METPLPWKLYGPLAHWWPLLSPPGEYAEDAARYAELLEGACAHRPRTLLELGSGGGHVAVHLAERYALTLVDLSPPMLDMSRALNPACEHVEGDMRTVRLGRSFDLVLIHDAIVYMTSEDDLFQALETARIHTAPGGAALFAPDFTRESFRTGVHCGGSDGPDRGIRYLEWTREPDDEESVYRVDYAYLLRETDGRVHAEHETHLEGLFPRATWLRLMREAGFDAGRVEHDTGDPAYGRVELFVGRAAP